jgi:hypothetical protein
MNLGNPGTTGTNQANLATNDRNIRERGRQRAPGQMYRPYKSMLMLNISVPRSLIIPPTSHYQQVRHNPTPYITPNGALIENDASHIQFPMRFPHFGHSQQRTSTDSSMSSFNTSRTCDSDYQSFTSRETFEVPQGLNQISGEVVEFHGNHHAPQTFQGNMDEVLNIRTDEQETFLSKKVHRDSESALDGRSEETGPTETGDLPVSDQLNVDTELPLNASAGSSPCGTINTNPKDSEIDTASERCLLSIF